MIVKCLPVWSPFVAMAIYPFILIRKDVYPTNRLINHERIHLRQQLEMLVIGFYLWYVIEWILRLFSYYSLSHEKEAYYNEDNMDYLKYREPYSWIKYL